MSANSTDPNLQLDKDLGKAHATARSLETEIVALVVETGLYGSWMHLFRGVQVLLLIHNITDTGAFIVLLLYAAHILRFVLHSTPLLLNPNHPLTHNSIY